MNKIPWWYWPVAFVPVAICGILGLDVFSSGILAGAEPLKEVANSNTANVAMAFSIYAALVLLGYLWLILCQPGSESAKEGDAASAE